MTEQTVRVWIDGAPRAYSYTWTGDPPLRIGDRVALPSNVVSRDGCEGTVLGFGSGGWTGELKGVTALLPSPCAGLWRGMAAVETQEGANGLYRAAQRLGMPPGQLEVLVRFGRAVLGTAGRKEEGGS